MMFALSIAASNRKRILSKAAFISFARSKEEAIGRGVLLAKQEFPEKDGWASHQCASCEVKLESFAKVQQDVLDCLKISIDELNFISMKGGSLSDVIARLSVLYLKCSEK